MIWLGMGRTFLHNATNQPVKKEFLPDQSDTRSELRISFKKAEQRQF